MDRALTIYTGERRQTSVWRRCEMSWPELRDRLTTFKVTPETYYDYLRMPRELQTDVKDVGGFVGGTLKDGIRKKANLESRSLITLDFDKFSREQLDELRDTFAGVSWVVYSTHKHCADEWRVRVVMPLTRDVDAEEYEAVGRKVADMIGMQGIDRTTFEPCRLMFWPSRSRDASYISEHNDGEMLDPDKILDIYEDWRDPAQWPRTPEEADLFATTAMPTNDPRALAIWSQYVGTPAKGKAKDGGSTLEDPVTKPGVIGAFCKTYDIESAIATYLPDTYTRYRDRRYSYTQGKTVGGAVIYDGKWLFSHHATDPASMRVLNAFDLVRVHKFGPLDAGSRADSVTGLPSHKAMTELAMADKHVRHTMSADATNRAQNAFADITLPDDDEVEDDWESIEAAMYDARGKFKATRKNLAVVLLRHPVFRGNIRYNDLSKQVEVVRGTMPWKRVQEAKLGATAGKKPNGSRSDLAWDDSTDGANLRSWMESTYEISTMQKLNDVMGMIQEPTKYNPIIEYLNSLTWDGTTRLADLLCVTLGAEPTPLNKHLSQLIFVAACARVREPGVKYDLCPVLYGSEGRGKSTLIALMGGEWTLDTALNIENKDAFMAIRGKWLVEMAEMASLKRADVDAVKSFISRTGDDYRAAYDKEVKHVPRTCVFVATTNSELCLRGDGDNRRFPVITCHDDAVVEPSWDYIPQWRDQLWAEADHLYQQGFGLYLPPDLDKEARRIGKAHNFDLNNPMFDQIAEYLDKPIPTTMWPLMSREERKAFIRGAGANSYAPENLEPRQQVCCAELLTECLDLRYDAKDYRNAGREVAAYMDRMQKDNWQRVEKVNDKVYGRQKGWRRIAPPKIEVEEEDII